MKRLIYTLLSAAAILVILESFVAPKPLRKDGTDPGYTGSPGDSLKNCTACHGGTPVDVEGWITSNIPNTGYVPGNTYTITATNTEPGGTRFGFEISPQNLAGDLLGTLLPKDNRTKLVGDNKYITYTADGVDGQGSNSWTFDWIAPPAGTGNVVFYGAFNSNFEGHKGSDLTYLSTLAVKESGSTYIKLPDGVSLFDVFPNPANDQVSIKLQLNKKSDLYVQITDMSGKATGIFYEQKEASGAVTVNFNTSSLAKGNYLISVKANGSLSSQKLSVW